MRVAVVWLDNAARTQNILGKQWLRARSTPTPPPPSRRNNNHDSGAGSFIVGLTGGLIAPLKSAQL